MPETPFLIQFFTNLVPDPSGYGQGQTYLGLDDGHDGWEREMRPIAYSPPAGLAANIWITATATNTLTGDTSEFSKAISAQPVSVQFQTATDSVDVTAGSVLVHVKRMGNPNAIVSVSYATSNGTAVAGKDYVAASGILTFRPGQMDQTFSVTVLNNPAQTAASVTVNLTLGQPTGGATLGSISTEVLTINVNAPPVLQFRSATYSVSASSTAALVTVTARRQPCRDRAGELRHGRGHGRRRDRLHSGLRDAHLPGQPDHGDVQRPHPPSGHGGQHDPGAGPGDSHRGAVLGPTSSAVLTITPGSSASPVGPAGPG